MLTREASARPGRWQTDRTPYVRQILGDLSPDSNVDTVVLMMATQLVKSETGLNWLGSTIDQDPAPFMVVQATVETGKRYSRQRVGTMIAACEVLRTKVRDPRERDSGNTLLMKQFPGGPLIITGANSAAGLASMPAQYIHFDEFDDYPDDVDGQGPPEDIARARQDAFFRRKVLFSSSPKRPRGSSKIETMFASGTRFFYNVPCPHCGAGQRLVMEHLAMNDDGHAVYICPHCGAEIDERHKGGMLAAGEWVAENPEAKVRSYTLNSLYSPPGWLSWTKIAEQFEKAKAALEAGDEAPMKAFLNTRLAQTYEERTDKVEADVLRDRAEDYPLRHVPEGVAAITCGTDTQDDRFECTLIGWGAQEEAWILDYTVLSGDPAQPDVWEKLDSYLASRFVSEDGRTLSIRATAIDTGGHFTHEVYAFARERRARRVFAIKGADRPGLPIKGRSSLVDVNFRGKVIPSGVRLWFVGTDSAKDLLHNRLKLTREGPGFMHLSQELPDEFFDGMTNEERRRIKTARGWRSTWVKKAGSRRNEPWDCCVYALFAAHAIDLPRYTEAMWSRLRARQKQERETETNPPPDPPLVNAAPTVSKANWTTSRGLRPGWVRTW